MKISIITTTYNIEDYIEDTLESVLTQKGDFYIEYIVYDACSTDTTYEKIKKYKKFVDDGFYKGRNLGIDMQIYQEKDNGMYEGVAKGIKKATGDIIAYINGDDYYMPNAFSTVCDVFSENENVNWIAGVINFYNSKGQNVNQDSFYYFYPKFILRGWNGTVFPFVQQESVFWRRELLKNFDYDVFSSLRLAGDFFLWHTFSKNGEICYLINSILSGFMHRDGQQSKALENYRSEMQFIVKKYTDLTKSANKKTIVPNVIEYSKNKWSIKRYTLIEILCLFKRKQFRKMFKYMFFKE